MGACHIYATKKAKRRTDDASKNVVSTSMHLQHDTTPTSLIISALRAKQANPPTSLLSLRINRSRLKRFPSCAGIEPDVDATKKKRVLASFVGLQPIARVGTS